MVGFIACAEHVCCAASFSCFGSKADAVLAQRHHKHVGNQAENVPKQSAIRRK